MEAMPVRAIKAMTLRVGLATTLLVESCSPHQLGQTPQTLVVAFQPLSYLEEEKCVLRTRPSIVAFPALHLAAKTFYLVANFYAAAPTFPFPTSHYGAQRRFSKLNPLTGARADTK